MTTIDRAAEVLWENAGRLVFGTSVAEHGGWDDLSGTARLPFTSAARALHKEGLLATEPRIVRTVEEYEDLHAETVVLNRRGNLMRAKNIWPHDDLPAVVVATGDHVRAARQALEEADAVD